MTDEHEIDEQWLDAIAKNWLSLTAKPWETRDGETPEEGRQANIGALFSYIEQQADQSTQIKQQLAQAQAKLQRYEKALQRLSKLGIQPLQGNSIGNKIAQEALNEQNQ